MIPLSTYAKVKDKYCLLCSGLKPEHLIQLVSIRPHIEAELPGLEIHIACKDSMLYLVKNEERIHAQSKLVEIKTQFAYVRQLKYDIVNNPIEAILMESSLNESLAYFHNEIFPQPNRLEKLSNQNKRRRCK
jgi:hypothetical protein